MQIPLWVALVIVSPFIGSFLGVVVLRSDDHRPIVFGRSQCDECHHSLDGRDLIPLISWLMLRRRCRYCGAELGLFYPAVEFAAIMPVLWAASVVSGWILVASAVFGWVLLTLGLIDWRTQRLPDVLTLSLLLSGLAAAYLFDRTSIVDHLIGAVAGYAIFALVAYLYRAIRGFDGLGLGDAKLLAGLGMWISWQGLPTLVLLAAVACLIFVVGRALWRRKIILTERVPFGPFLALAGWIVWLYGPLVPA
ncbi:MAG: A24 family peptidase [Rhizomicrobium sp.]